MAKRNFGNGKNATKVSEIISSSNMSGNAATTVDLDISKIDENPDNEKIFDMSGIDALVNEIQEFGFAGAIDVYQKEDGRYELSSGHRRYRAMKALGKKTIPAIIKPMPPETVRRHMLIHSNTMNRVLSYMDLAKAIRYERATYTIEMAIEKGVEYSMDKDGDVKANVEQGAVMDKLAKAFNMSVAQVYKYLKLNEINKGIVELVEKRRIPFDCMSLFSSKDKDIQETIYKALVSELSHADYGSKDLSSLSMSQCSLIIKSILSKTKDEQPVVPQRQESNPIPIDFSEGMEEKRDIFEPDSSQPQSISFPAIMKSGKAGEVDSGDEKVEKKMEIKESPAARVRTLLENDSSDGSHISTEEATEKVVREYHNYIDNTIIMFTSQMSILVQNDFDIKNKEKLSQNIEALENILKTIKDKL